MSSQSSRSEAVLTLSLDCLGVEPARRVCQQFERDLLAIFSPLHAVRLS